MAAGMCILKAVNTMSTRYAHQVTTAVLDILRNKSLTVKHLYLEKNGFQFCRNNTQRSSSGH